MTKTFTPTTIPGKHAGRIKEHLQRADDLRGILQDALDSAAAHELPLTLNDLDRMAKGESVDSVVRDIFFANVAVPAGVAPARWREMIDTSSADAWVNDMRAWLRAWHGTLRHETPNGLHFPYRLPSDFLSLSAGRLQVRADAVETIRTRLSVAIDTPEKADAYELAQKCVESLQALRNALGGRDPIAAGLLHASASKYEVNVERLISAFV